MTNQNQKIMQNPSESEAIQKETQRKLKIANLLLARFKKMHRKSVSKQIHSFNLSINREKRNKKQEQQQTEPNEEEESDEIKSFKHEIAQELATYLRTEPKCRNYSPRLKELCFALYNLSPSAYRFLSCLLPIPHERSIFRLFSDDVRCKENQITDINRIPEIITNFRLEYGIEPDVDIPVVLGIDACSFDRITSANHKYSFCFYIQPISPHLRCFPLHIISHEDGKANAAILNLRKKIVQALQENHVNVFAQATDGDNSYNVENEETLDLYFHFVIQHGVDEAVNYFAKYDNITFNLGDMLHILKIARSRLLSGIPITFSFYNTNCTVSLSKMIEVLDIGKALTDKSSTSKMKDFYPLKIFTMENVQKLLDANHFAEAMYLLPYSLWVAAITIPGVEKESRIELLKMSFGLFHSLFLHSYNHDDVSGITYTARGSSSALFFADDALLIRSMNATFVSAVALTKFDEIALDRIGTHVLENFFGKIRYMCDNYDSWQHILSATAKAQMISQISAHYHINFMVQGRVNIGGVKVTTEESVNIHYICVYPIEGFYKAYAQFTSSFAAPTLLYNSFYQPITKQTFTLLIHNICHIFDYKHHLYEPGPATATKIKARCVFSDPELTAKLEEKRKMLMAETIQKLSDNPISREEEEIINFKDEDRVHLIDSLYETDRVQSEYAEQMQKYDLEIQDIKKRISEYERERDEIINKERCENTIDVETKRVQELNYEDLCKSISKELKNKLDARNECKSKYLEFLGEVIDSDLLKNLFNALGISKNRKHSNPLLFQVADVVFPSHLTPFEVRKKIKNKYEIADEIRDDLNFLNELVTV